MNILQITSHLNVGGVTSHVLALSKGLNARGHGVAVASGGGAREADVASAGMSHLRVPLQTSVEFSPQVWWAGRRLASWLRAHPVDIIHAHTRVAQVVAHRLARARRIPYVATWHGFFRRNLGRTWWPCLGDVTLAVSEPVGEHVRRDFHRRPESLRVIPNGIDVVSFADGADAASRRRFREQCRLPPDAPVIGTVSRLVASKGLDQIIRSLPGVRSRVPDARLLVVGAGEARADLERVASALGVREAVHFAGAMSDPRVAYATMRVVVFMPADREGFGLSLLEAMASGRPVVAVRRGGGSQWVLEQGGVGAVVEPDDPDRLSAAITRLLQDEALAAQVAAQAREMVTQRYSLSRMVDAVEHVYQELVKREA
jgi:glycosyltransferase involved in cell wall biosynthesis